MSADTGATLLVAAACLFGVGLFALSHRRDAFGAVLAVILGFDAVACALIGFAGLSASRVEAAQLQSFAVVAEVIGVLLAAAGISMAALLRRRTGGRDLLELALAGPRPASPQETEDDDFESRPGDERSDEAEAEEAGAEPTAEVDEEG